MQDHSFRSQWTMNSKLLPLIGSLAVTAAPAAAGAVALAAGVYGQTGTVASNNGNANCESAGLGVGTVNDGTLDFPGNGKPGLALYLPQSGSEYLCNGFSAIPASCTATINATLIFSER